MNNIQITQHMKDGSTKVKMLTPYHADVVAGAKRLNGKWSSDDRAWYFDIRDEERVRDLARSVFGTDGTDSPETRDVQVVLAPRQGREVWKYGRCLVRRLYRDSPPVLGDGVIILAGDFPKRGGSRKYPELANTTEVVLEVRDVPVTLLNGD